MISLIWWYIQIIGLSYLESGLLIVCLGFIVHFIYPSDETFTLKDFLLTIILHPWVIYHFVKQYYENR
jgi:hypothetical protein